MFRMSWWGRRLVAIVCVGDLLIDVDPVAYAGFFFKGRVLQCRASPEKVAGGGGGGAQ